MIQGVTFSQARSVSIKASGNSVASLLLKDCEFNGNNGRSIIEIYDGGLAENVVVDLNNIPEPPGMSMTVVIIECTFRDNILSMSPVSVFFGILAVTGCIFSENSGQVGGILVMQGGQVGLSESCFIDSESKELPGIVFIDEDSLPLQNDQNFGSGNEGLDINNCPFIFLETDGSCVENADQCKGNCDEFSSQECLQLQSPEPSPLSETAEPSVTPTAIITPQPSFGCFTKWDRLSLAILKACNEGLGSNFILCPNTLFDVNDYPDSLVTPIIIYSSDITIQCGDDGKWSNNCIISGGITQFKLKNFLMGVEFRGVIFEKSRGMSIFAAASQDSNALFIDCEWRNNEGSSTISLIDMKKTGAAMMIGLRIQELFYFKINN